MEWFRWFHGTTSDPKLAVVAKRSKQPRHVVLACWAVLLEYASEQDNRGDIGGIDLEIMAVTLDLDIEQVESVLTAMRDKDMIEGDHLSAWEKRQPTVEKYDYTANDRLKRFREKKRQDKKCNGDETGMKRDETGSKEKCNGDETGETPVRLREDTDKDKDKTLEPKNLKSIGTKSAFRPPSLDEVRAYCIERQNRVDPDRWYSHYESNGWKVGRNPMKDWQASIRTWEKNEISPPIRAQNEFQGFASKGAQTALARSAELRRKSMEAQNV